MHSFLDVLRIIKRNTYNKIADKEKHKRLMYYDGSVESLFTNSDIWNSSITVLYKEHNGDIAYFSKLYSRVKDDVDEIKLLINSFIDKCNNEYDRVIAYRFLMDLELMEPSDLKSYISVINNLKNPQMAYCLNIDIQSYVYRHKNVMYEGFYIDRRVLLKKIAQEFWGDRNTEFNNNNNNRIAISAKILEGEKSATANYIFDDALALLRQGKEIEIFVSGYFYYNDGDSYIKPKFPRDDVSSKYKEFHKKATGGKIYIHYPEGKTIEERFVNYIFSIQKYNPSAIIDYSGQQGFETAILTKMYPVLYIPTAGFAFNDFFHRFMCSDREMCLKENQKYHSITEDQIVEYDKPIRNKVALRQFQRKESGFDDEDFILVTVGVRIEFELEPECVDNICNIISNHKNIKWLIVSPNKHEYITSNYSMLIKQKKVIFWGVENDLVGLYGICNAYVNPNRTGGGASIAYAMHAGLPILMNYYASDALPYVGRDVLTNNYVEMADELDKLVNDSRYYKKRKKETLERANKYNVDNSVRQYLDAIKSMKKDIANGKIKV